MIWNIEQGRALSGPDIGRAMRLRSELYRRVHTFFCDYDFLLAPVSQLPPFSVDTPFPTEVAGRPMATYIEWMRSCSRITVTAHPAISLPAGFTPEGLPVGLQIVGRARDDWGVLQLAHAFEAATGHWRQRPPLVEAARTAAGTDTAPRLGIVTRQQIEQCSARLAPIGPRAARRHTMRRPSSRVLLLALSCLLLAPLVPNPAPAAAQDAAAQFADALAARDRAASLAGPTSGELTQQENVIATAGAGVNVADFSASATFVNPTDGADTPWDIGFSFHGTPSDVEQIAVDSTGTWYYTPYPAGVVQSGFDPSFDATPGGANTIDLVVDGTQALFGLNGHFLARSTCHRASRRTSKSAPATSRPPRPRIASSAIRTSRFGRSPPRRPRRRRADRSRSGRRPRGRSRWKPRPRR